MAQFPPMAQADKITGRNCIEKQAVNSGIIPARHSGCKSITARIAQVISLAYIVAIAPFRKYLKANKPLFYLVALIFNGAVFMPLPCPADDDDGPSSQNAANNSYAASHDGAPAGGTSTSPK